MLPFSRNELVSVAEPPTEWVKLWKQYMNSYENWKQLFDSVQKASTDMQQRFNDVMEKAPKESSSDIMKQFGENCQNAMNQAGIDASKTFGESWQKAMNEASFEAYKQFAENCQKTLNESGMEPMKAYGELMKTFAETWNNMWPQK